MRNAFLLSLLLRKYIFKNHTRRLFAKKKKKNTFDIGFFFTLFFSSVGFYKALVCILGYCPDQPTETYGYGGFYVVCACVKTKNNGLFYQYSSILRIYIHCQWTSDNYGHVFISF